MTMYLPYFVILLSFCNAYKILVVFPYPIRSHGNLGHGVVRNLLKEGHEITYISPFSYETSSSKLRMVNVSTNSKMLPDNMYNFQALVNKEYQFNNHGQLIHDLNNVMKHTVENDNVQKLLNDTQEHFDIVIIEWLLTEVLAGFSAIFNCPLIWASALDTHWFLLRLIDQSPSPTYSADIMSSIIPPFTFWERISELYTQLKVLYLKYMYFNELERQTYEKLFTPFVAKRDRELPSYHDIQYNASLVLGLSHSSLGKALAIPQNYINLAGYHIAEDVQPLPENIKNIMDNATDRVIYFSMGSNLKSKDIPKETQDGIVKIFSELKQTVIWKFEGNLSDIPQNLHIMEWAPQQSILAHPNTALFITHGGLLSTIEAIHFGVPVIGIPIFADQYVNIATSVKRGFAIKIDFSYNITKELKAAINEVMKNPRYTEKAKELSFIYHDRPLTPGKELAHWVRHVIQTRGAPHLRSPALHVPFYEKLYLDLLIVVLIILVTIIRLLRFIAYYITKYKPLNMQDTKKKM